MKYCYITGTSRGIGKALAEMLLKNGYAVIGISRQCTISDLNYLHLELDLNDVEQVSEFEFGWHKEPESVVLINNAGMLGDINRVGNVDNDSIQQAFNVNAISPLILTNKFVDTYKNTKAQKVIVNISSGAGRHTIKSWSTYCATKSAIDMYSKVLNDEQLEEGSGVKIFSVAPGIVDTQMQDEIRKLTDSAFPDKNRFVQLKNENKLSSTQSVATQIMKIIDKPEKYDEVLLDLRTLK